MITIASGFENSVYVDCINFFPNYKKYYLINMKLQTSRKNSLYNQQTYTLFTQLICETEFLYQKVMTKIKQNSQSVEVNS